MTTLKFVDTHNMVAFLSKPAESEGFEQIVDFLNANLIRYALTINPTIYTSCIEQLWATVKAKTVNEEVQLQALVDGKKVIITEASVRSDLQLDDEEGMDCLPNATIFEELTRMGYEKLSQKLTFYKAFFSPQFFLDKQLEGMQIHKRIYDAPSHIKKIFGNVKRVGKCFSGRETPLFPTMVVQNQAEKGEGSTIPTDPHYTPTIIQPSTSQPQRKQRPRKPKRKDTEVPQSSSLTGQCSRDEAVNGRWMDQFRKVGLSRRVESSDEECLGEEDASEQGRIADIDADAGINLVSTHFDADTNMFEVRDLVDDEVVVKSEVTIKDVNLSVDEVTLAQALASLKSAKVQEKGNVIKETSVPVSVAHALTKVSTATTTTATIPTPRKGIVIQEIDTTTTPTTTIHVPKPPHDKGKGIMVEEPVSKIEADYQLAQRLKAQEQEELTDAEKARLFVQFLEQRRKHFAAKRVEGKNRNKPPTRAQQRSIMCTYLKNMEGWKPKDLKNKSFANIQELFDKARKRVNTFVDYKTELVEESSKKAEAETTQERSSKRAGEELE
ncbi:hypothetical protein Tco_0312300 [Tanacetum coccineum]